MEDQNLKMKRARELFFMFYGNEFFMWKDGYLDEYKSFHVSEEQKLIWRDELSQELYSKLEVKHDSTLSGLCNIINFFGDYKFLDRVLNFVSMNYRSADSFLKLRYAEVLFDIIEKSQLHSDSPQELIIKTKKLALSILNNILINDIEIDVESEKILEFNQNLPDKDYIIDRTRNLKKRVESFEIK